MHVSGKDAALGFEEQTFGVPCLLCGLAFCLRQYGQRAPSIAPWVQYDCAFGGGGCGRTHTKKAGRIGIANRSAQGMAYLRAAQIAMYPRSKLFFFLFLLLGFIIIIVAASHISITFIRMVRAVPS